MILVLCLIAAYALFSKHPSAPASDRTDLVSATQTYSDPDLGFSFGYPAGYTVSSTSDEDAGMKTILIQSSDIGTSTDDLKGVEIIVSPFDKEVSALTVDRIRQDLPDMAINSPQDIIVGSGADVGRGIAFSSDDADFGGNSRNAWFVSNGSLYQVTTYAADEAILRSILESWSFR